MGQQEVYNWLLLRRETEPNKYYSIKQIKRALPGHNGTIARHINRLYAFGFLEIKVFTKGFIFNIERKYRAKVPI